MYPEQILELSYMNLKTFLVEVTKQIREGTAAAKCMPVARIEMDIAIASDGRVTSRCAGNCSRVHIIVTMLPNV